MQVGIGVGEEGGHAEMMGEVGLRGNGRLGGGGGKE